MYEIQTLPVSDLAQNCRILYGAGGEAIVIDPGADYSKIQDFLISRSLRVSQIWLTHSHLDHAGAVAPLLEAHPEALLYGHEIERDMRSRIEQIAELYGFPAGVFKNCPEPHKYLSGGEFLPALGVTFAVLFTPGHSPGHLCFYDEEQGVLIAGDTLFQGSIGRYDLPMASGVDLMRSIHGKLLTLPDEVVVMPGHGPNTTIGNERRTNPYLRESFKL